MSKRRYNKPPLTYPQLLQQLKDRGLAVRDEPKALHLLKNISYYRLSGYWYLLLEDKVNHVFKPGSTFETAFKLYCFDRELRLMVMREIEKIEVAVRSHMNHIMAHYKGVYWFRDETIFRNRVLSIRPRIPRSPQNLWLNQNPGNDKVYFVLSMIIYFLNTVNPKHTFRERFSMLLDKFPNVDTYAMGFPEIWKDEVFWGIRNKSSWLKIKNLFSEFFKQ